MNVKFDVAIIRAISVKAYFVSVCYVILKRNLSG